MWGYLFIAPASLSAQCHLHAVQYFSAGLYQSIHVAYPKYKYIKYSDAEESQNTLFVQVRNFYQLLEFRFSTRGERETHNFYCADCSYIIFQSIPQLNSRPIVKISTNWPNKHAAHPIAHNWTCLTQVRISTNCFFSKSPRISAHCIWARRHSHPSLISYLGFLLWHLWLPCPLRASVNTCTKSWIVQSLTKPNDKI